MIRVLGLPDSSVHNSRENLGSGLVVGWMAKGMTADELETMCATPPRARMGPVPWVCWESENSSFGKCFRIWSGFPRFLPLAVCSPHGAYGGTKLLPSEIDGRADVFFGWPETLVRRRQNDHGLPSFVVPHPWPNYRKRTFGALPPERQGVLYFFPHSNAHYRPSFRDLDGLKCELSQIDEKLGPVSICLSFHDVRAGLHHDLETWGFPLVTAGHTADQRFVDRFYGLIYGVSHTAGSHVGSHSYYSIEAGVPHFLTQSRNTFVGTGVEQEDQKVAALSDYFYEADLPYVHQFFLSLEEIVSEPTEYQKEFVANILAVGQGLSPEAARKILWTQLFKFFPSILALYFTRLSVLRRPKSGW